MPNTHRTPEKIAIMRARQTITVGGVERISCPLCANPISSKHNTWDIDHIVPRSKGGSNTIENLQLVHKTCNNNKADSEGHWTQFHASMRTANRYFIDMQIAYLNAFRQYLVWCRDNV